MKIMVFALAGLFGIAGLGATTEASSPVKVILDTDIGNDVDDALALAMLHTLADRKEVEILAVTICKDNPWAAVYVDVVNHFYGRASIPIGTVRHGVTPEDGPYIRAVSERKIGDSFVYPRRLKSGKDAPDAVRLLRKTLSGQPDGSVVLVSIGFLTNIARLLDSKPDDISPLSGADLVRQKVRLYSMMAGEFGGEGRAEYNVVGDLPASRTVFERWPTPIVVSGFEVGLAIRYPAESIEKDYAYVENHPIAEAYRLFDKMPHDRPCWDLTSVLYAVRPDRGYFGLSPEGTIALDAEGRTAFQAKSGGLHRYLTATSEQVVKAREAFVWLVSAPPSVR